MKHINIDLSRSEGVMNIMHAVNNGPRRDLLPAVPHSGQPFEELLSPPEDRRSGFHR